MEFVPRIPSRTPNKLRSAFDLHYLNLILRHYSSGLDDDLDPCFCSEVVDQRLIAEKEYMSLKSLLSIHQTYSATITRLAPPHF